MRRLFGLKSTKATSPSLSPLESVSNGEKDLARPCDPAVAAKQHDGLGLGLELEREREREQVQVQVQVRKSRHVHYDTAASAASSSTAGPPLHAQPSFESRHGGGNCFPLARTGSASDSHASNSNSTSTSTSAPTPQAPAPLRPAAAAAAALSSSEHSPNSNSIDIQRSFSPSGASTSTAGPGPGPGRGASPYSYGVQANPSLARLADRDPSQIYAPLTWSELAHDDLVQNISPRERTRQEILWEVVASEERYVAELRSLVELYVNPLLHPLLTPPTSPPLSYLSSPSPSPYQHPIPASSQSHSPLPIAARFARSDSASSSGSASPFGPWANHTSPREADVGDSELPEIDGSDAGHGHGHGRTPTGARSHASLPALPRGVHSTGFGFPSSPSSVSLAATVPDRPRMGLAIGRLAGLPGFRPRHPQKPPPGSSKLHKHKVPKELFSPPPLPPGLKSVLEAIPEMLRGHEELSERLKTQWVKAFPLVRGLALIWSDQPWFLEVYAKYILSLEEALLTIDRCLPSAHSPDKGRGPDKEDKRLARFIMNCEERASVEGEASLAIALSKPLMRLGKLPLLMQSLLYHTDATTVEYEKTRAMALEVDALVRSIEDEKIEEDEREKVRDVLARIDGIKDKALMAPRSTRLLLEEIPVFPSSNSTPPNASPSNARRTVSESTPSRHSKSSVGTHPSPPQMTSKKSIKRLSDLMPRSDHGGGKSDWFVVFSDVTIRCVKVGSTDIPGGFSREKEKQGKQGKTRKKGKTRNLYRFVKVERWEMNDASRSGLVSMEDIHRVRTSGADTLDETSEEDDDDDDDDFDAESRMSFSYEADDPKPMAPRNFKSDAGRPRSSTPKGSSALRSVSSTTRSVVAKQTPAKQKFGTRGPSLGPVAGQRFQAPTAASIARANTPSAAGGRTTLSPTSRVLSPSTAPRPTPTPSSAASAAPPVKRGLSSPASQPPPKHGGIHTRDDSTLQMYEAYWGGDDAPAVPFPRT